MGDFGSVPFEEVLIDAAAFVQHSEHRLQPLRAIVNSICVQGLVVHAPHSQNHPEISTLGEKGVIVDESKKINLLVERARLAIMLLDFCQLKQCELPEPQWEQTSSGHTAAVS